MSSISPRKYAIAEGHPNSGMQAQAEAMPFLASRAMLAYRWAPMSEHDCSAKRYVRSRPAVRA